MEQRVSLEALIFVLDDQVYFLSDLRHQSVCERVVPMANDLDAFAAPIRAALARSEQRWEAAGLVPGQHFGSKIAFAAMSAAGWPSGLSVDHPQWGVFCDGAGEAVRDIVAAAVKVGREQGADAALGGTYGK